MKTINEKIANTIIEHTEEDILGIDASDIIESLSLKEYTEIFEELEIRRYADEEIVGCDSIDDTTQRTYSLKGESGEVTFITDYGVFIEGKRKHKIIEILFKDN